MTDATLGFKIDSSQASSAAADLDRLTAAAARTQQAADKLEAEAASLSGSLSRAGEGASKAAPPMERMAKSLADQDDHVRAFRMEVERLTMKFQPLAQATRTYEAAVSEIDRAHKLGVINAQQMTQALDRERMAYEKLRTSAASAGAAVKAANSNNAASGSQRAAGINAGYQFQDIAVTAAMGMNPLMIGLQQGTQLASVIGSMERPVAGLAAAFGSMISPISLVTIGLTAGVAALVQYFSASKEGSDGMNTALREQAELITGLADRWGDAVPSLKQYADELIRAKEASELQAGVGLLSEKTLKDVRSGLDNAKIGLADLSSQLRQAGTESGTVLQLENAFTAFAEAADKGKLSSSEVNAVQTALTAAIKENHIPALDDFAKVFEQISKSALTAADSIGKTGEAAALAQSRMNDPRTWRSYGRNDQFGADGTILGTQFPLPDIGPMPAQRPNDLSEAPDAATILNGDGRLTNVPVPGQRPNFFEIEEQTEKVDDLEKAYRRAQEAKADFWLDIGFQQRQAERSAMDQQVAGTLSRYGFNEDLNSPEAQAIRQQLRGQQAKDLAKGFGDAFASELVSGSHDIGKAFLKGFESALTNEASKLWEKFFDGIGNLFAGMITGGKSGGSATTGIGSAVTSALGGAASDNRSASGAGSISGSGANLAWNFWKSKGLADHQVAGILGNIKAESAFNPSAVGDGGDALGLYQWNDRSPSLLKAIGGRGNLGNELSQHQFAYSELMGPESRSWNALRNAPDVRSATAAFAGFERPQGFSWGNPEGSYNFVGRLNGAEEALAKFGGTAGTATEGLGKFGTGLNSLGSTLAAPGASSAPGASGGGGPFSWLGSLFGGGQFAQAKAGLLKPGLFADGTNYAPGGLAIVGERGPELVNLPQGSQVFNTNRSAQMMGDNDSAPRQRPHLNVYVQGGSGDEHVRELARQGAQEALYQDKVDQARGGFGNTQKKFNTRKG
ncbi:phage tail tape measure protein [Rhizobium sp. WYCCWR 11152]|uniref:phage tail tip lysozyme n=1 Tax=Rhizobium sp. WYCCWR 11152 TaxID=2692316 RepID=UPI001490DAFE|nr:phage tail tip lysozyme [Rhizobium sp. WYCCWR 11152]NNU66526.1 phage tail tape measure protein [Rhizobium sp. WYCCWR 11152]